MEKKLQVMELWRRNFHDSEEFIQFYFARKYSDSNSLVYEENGRALSAFLMLPYPMYWQGLSLNTSYISGACTSEEARNHGFMTLLLTEAFLEMNKREIALSTLIPAEEWLIDFYGKLGYTTVFDYSIEKHQMDIQQPDSSFFVNCPPNYDPGFAKSLFPYFDKKMKSRTCCVQHPSEDYLAIVEDTYLSGGRLAAIYAPGRDLPAGWALAVPEQEIIRIKEFFFDSMEEKKALLQYFAKLWQNPQIECKILPGENNVQHYGMARITNACIMLQQIALKHPDLTVSLTLHDPYLPANEGSYLLSEGKCEKQETQKLQTDLVTDIPTLTKALLGYHIEQLPQNFAEFVEKQSPFMNLMLD